MARKAGSITEPPHDSVAPSDVEAPRRAERRYLTVMFCDLVGSSRLAATLDTEDFSELIVSYRRSAVAVIERYGGCVIRYIGDGILACWGYPRAYEDDNRRSLAAAVDLLAFIPAIGEKLPFLRAPASVRVALDSGTCVVGMLGAGGVDIVGEAPNNAAFLQGRAGPNEIVATQSVIERAGHVFEIAPAEQVILKSGGEKITTYRVLARRGAWWHRLPVTVTKMIGREAECERLERYWQDALAGRGIPLVITGEAGIGKSTLLARLRQDQRTRESTAARA